MRTDSNERMVTPEGFRPASAEQRLKERGRAGDEKYQRDFNKLIWQLASPRWHFDDTTFEGSAASFDNPDHVSIVIHNYRWRLGLAEGESQYDEREKRLAAAPQAFAQAIVDLDSA